MVNEFPGYSTKYDLLVGDIPLQQQHGDGTAMVKMTAGDIDAQIGHIYVTPIALSEVDPKTRPARLLLARINNLFASGRLVLDSAAAGEDDSLHSYGQSMIREASNLLKDIQLGRIVLTGAVRIDGTDGSSAPSIVQTDAVSLVEAFYNPLARGQFGQMPLPYSAKN